MSKKIAIVGTAPSSVNLAPYGDESWEIWSLGSNIHNIPRFTRWFELHHQKVLEACQAWPQLFDKLKFAGDKLVIGHPNELLPEAKLLPVQELRNAFGNYFTSSIAWMLAMAIYEKPDMIGLFGVDMIGDGEYSHQRACCEYFLGMARGMGIKVVIPDESPLLRADRMYGIEDCKLATELSKDLQELSKRHSSAMERLRTAIEDEAFYRGQQYYHKKIERRWG